MPTLGERRMLAFAGEQPSSEGALPRQETSFTLNPLEWLKRDAANISKIQELIPQPVRDAVSGGYRSLEGAVTKMFSGKTEATPDELQKREESARDIVAKHKDKTPQQLAEYFADLERGHKEVIAANPTAFDALKGLSDADVSAMRYNRANCPELCVWWDAFKGSPEKQQVVLKAFNAIFRHQGFELLPPTGDKTEFGVRRAEGAAVDPDASPDNDALADIETSFAKFLDSMGIESGAQTEMKKLFKGVMESFSPLFTKSAQTETRLNDVSQDRDALEALRTERKNVLSQGGSLDEAIQKTLDQELGQIESEIGSLDTEIRSLGATVDQAVSQTQTLLSSMEGGRGITVTSAGEAVIVHGSPEQVQCVTQCAERTGNLVTLYPGSEKVAITVPAGTKPSVESLFGCKPQSCQNFFRQEIKQSTQVVQQEKEQCKQKRQECRCKAAEHRAECARRQVEQCWNQFDAAVPPPPQFPNRYRPCARPGVMLSNMHPGPMMPFGWNAPGITPFQRNFFDHRFANWQSLNARARHLNYPRH